MFSTSSKSHSSSTQVGHHQVHMLCSIFFHLVFKAVQMLGIVNEYSLLFEKGAIQKTS